MRINKFIASNTIFSRRKADELIKTGKVFLNGKQLKKLGIEIDLQKDKVQIGKKIVRAKAEKIYIALNKPAGYVTTRSDDLKRKTVMDLIPKGQNLKPVGRLDRDSEGLLLLSNDGEFINEYTHPKFKCKKEYFVKIKGKLEDEEKNKLEKGVEIEGKKTSEARIRIIKKSEKETVLRIIIHEGRKRQIRKMFDYVDHPVKYLQRIQIGKIKLGSLKTGEYRILKRPSPQAHGRQP